MLFYAKLCANETAKSKTVDRLSGAFNKTAEVKEKFILPFKKNLPELQATESTKISAGLDSNTLANEDVEIYSKYFSEAEVDEMLKFHNSEVGKKMVKNLPAIFGETLNASKKVGAKFENFYSANINKRWIFKKSPTEKCFGTANSNETVLNKKPQKFLRFYLTNSYRSHTQTAADQFIIKQRKFFGFFFES